MSTRVLFYVGHIFISIIVNYNSNQDFTNYSFSSIKNNWIIMHLVYYNEQYQYLKNCFNSIAYTDPHQMQISTVIQKVIISDVVVFGFWSTHIRKTYRFLFLKQMWNSRQTCRLDLYPTFEILATHCHWQYCVAFCF